MSHRQLQFKNVEAAREWFETLPDSIQMAAAEMIYILIEENCNKRSVQSNTNKNTMTLDPA